MGRLEFHGRSNPYEQPLPNASTNRHAAGQTLIEEDAKLNKQLAQA
ncbi:hypothetical protein ACIBI9_46095 [Nonomuraea sp. NPDC050451]